MVNRSPNAPYEEFYAAWEFLWQQGLKELWTSMPGVVVSYDPDQRLATVQPALRQVLEDGTERSVPPVARVPVLLPAAGGWQINLPLTEGDPVLLIFSQRGLNRWKRDGYAEATPDAQGMLSLKDAIALPGFVPPARAETHGELVIENHDRSVQFVVGAKGVVVVGNLEVSGDIMVSGGITAPDGNWHEAAHAH